MTSSRNWNYTIAHAEIQVGKVAQEIGNIGKVRVCARRGCFFAIAYWLDFNPEKNWGDSAISMLTNLQEDFTIPKEIRDAAQRLTKQVDQNFETGISEDPLDDGELIIEYFLDRDHFK